MKKWAWNLRIVSVLPPRMQGGRTAAAREPSPGGRIKDRLFVVHIIVECAGE